MFSGFNREQEYTPLAQEEEEDDDQFIDNNENNKSLLVSNDNENDSEGHEQEFANGGSSLSLKGNNNKRGLSEEDEVGGGSGTAGSYFGSGFPFGFNAICMCITVTIACVLLLGISSFVVIMFRVKQIAAEMKDDKPIVVLVGIDGFRHDFLEKFAAQTSVLRQMAEKDGVKAERLIPVFPSTTLPNMYSIVTGNYPAKHGILGKEVFDRDSYNSYNLSDPNVFLSVPIWNTIEQAKIPTASVHWFGGNVKINGSQPTYTNDDIILSKDRVHKVLSHLDKKRNIRPRFISLYLDEVDRAAHSNGVDSDETKKAVKQVNDAIGTLLQGIKKRGSYIPNVQVIIVSDHGMIDIKDNQTDLKNIFMSDTKVRVIPSNSAVANVFSEGTDELYTKLEVIGEMSKQFAVYDTNTQRDDRLVKLKYTGSSRIGDIVLVAKPGYVIHNSDIPLVKASHGYDPKECPEMNGIFLAQGTRFQKAGKTVAEFENISIYPLICKLLNVACPTDRDGKLGVVSELLVADSK